MKYKIEHKIRKSSTTFTVVDELGNEIGTRTSKDRWFVGAKIVEVTKAKQIGISLGVGLGDDSLPFVASWHMTMDQAHKPIPGYRKSWTLVAVATGPEKEVVA